MYERNKSAEPGPLLLRTYYFILLANGRLWRYQGASRPAVFFSPRHARDVLNMMELEGAQVITEDGPVLLSEMPSA